MVKNCYTPIRPFLCAVEIFIIILIGEKIVGLFF